MNNIIYIKIRHRQNWNFTHNIIKTVIVIISEQLTPLISKTVEIFLKNSMSLTMISDSSSCIYYISTCYSSSFTNQNVVMYQAGCCIRSKILPHRFGVVIRMRTMSADRLSTWDFSSTGWNMRKWAPDCTDPVTDGTHLPLLHPTAVLLVSFFLFRTTLLISLTRRKRRDLDPSWWVLLQGFYDLIRNLNLWCLVINAVVVNTF